MPRLRRAVPRLCKKTIGGQAYATAWIAGQQRYFGRWGTRAAMTEYDAAIGEWLAAGRPSTTRPPEKETTVSELVAEFWKYCKRVYRARTADNFKPVLRDLRKRYGRRPVSQFGPKSLKALRASYVSDGCTRRHANEKTSKIRQVFGWGVAEELCPLEVHQRLERVAGLREGEARESSPVRPVPVADFEETLEYLPETLRDFLRLQLLTAARPGEIADLRPADVDTTRDPWEYRPASHKTAHHGKNRLILIGPRGQDILRPYLLRPADQRCFRPCDSEKKRRRERTEARVTAESCGNVVGSNRKTKAKRRPGERYGKDAVARAVRRAVAILNEDRAKNGLEPIPGWSPNMLRHAAATMLREKYGIEHAQTILGHSRSSTTEIYAERNVNAAREAIREIG